MRILHVVPTYFPAVRYGGPIYSVHGLCSALARLGHDVHVYSTSVDGDRDSPVPLGTPVERDGVKVWYYRSTLVRRLYFSTTLARAVQRTVRQFDLVHVHSVFLWPTLVAARLARREGKPYVVSPRGILVKDSIRRRGWLRKNGWIWLFERKTFEKASAIHCTSRRELEQTEAFGWQLPPCWVIPNGFDAVAGAGDGARDPGMLLFLGRVSWEKGLDRLIRSLAYAKQARLVVAGNCEHAYRTQLEALAQSSGVRDRVSFAGFVEGAAKQELLRRASWLVLPSYTENFGNVVLEAWSERCPVIVTPEVGLAETVRTSGGGVVCRGIPEELGRCIERHLADPEAQRQMGNAGLQLVMEQFSWTSVACAMESHYRNLLSEPRP